MNILTTRMASAVVTVGLILPVPWLGWQVIRVRNKA
jgi:hypothetical protein